MIRTWGKFFRVQTFAATAMSPVLGAVCAIGLDWRLLIVFVWGTLVHLWGFGMNNWCDRFYDTGRQHSNPISKGYIDANIALGAVVLAWLVVWITPLLFIETSILRVYIPMLIMCGTGAMYNLWSKEYLVLPGVWLGSWIMMLTITGHTFFSSQDSNLVGLLAAIAFAQLWCQWIEGLLKDRGTDPNNLASVLKGWQWDAFAWSSKVAQVILVDVLLWWQMPDIPYMVLVFILIMVSVVLWGLLTEAKDRAKMLRFSGAHEIVFFGAVVFALQPILGHWSWAFILVPAACYAVLNRLLYGTFGRPTV